MGGLRLHPVNMAMFGYLYLKNGMLNGEQVVPENWLKESTAKHIVANEKGDYGYLWWRINDNLAEERGLEINDIFYASGFAGQFVFIIPPFCFFSNPIAYFEGLSFFKRFLYSLSRY